MRKLLLLLTLLSANYYYSQVSSAMEFLEFAKLSLDKQTLILKKAGWESTSEAAKPNKPNAAFKIKSSLSWRRKVKNENLYYSLKVKVIDMPAGRMKETKFIIPGQNGLIMSDWISELARNGYSLSQINSYVMTAVGENFTVMIKMFPSDGYSEPMSEISYMVNQ